MGLCMIKGTILLNVASESHRKMKVFAKKKKKKKFFNFYFMHFPYFMQLS